MRTIFCGIFVRKEAYFLLLYQTTRVITVSDKPFFSLFEQFLNYNPVLKKATTRNGCFYDASKYPWYLLHTVASLTTGSYCLGKEFALQDSETIPNAVTRRENGLIRKIFRHIFEERQLLKLPFRLSVQVLKGKWVNSKMMEIAFKTFH